MKQKVLLTLIAVLSALNVSAQPKKYAPDYRSATTPHECIVVAYVGAGSDVMPDPFVMTHINYAFGHVNESFNGVNISNPERLKKISALKIINPDLKVMLSIGGWGSGRFSEMAENPTYRKSFAKDCARIMKEFNLDGIDIDWEYPTNGGAGISESAADTYNYTLLMRDLRKALGKKALLTLASSSSARFIDFPSIIPYISFVNVMSYDMGTPPMGWHNALYPSSKHPRSNSCQTAVDRHIKVGIPITMITMGLPFYGRGARGQQNYLDWKEFVEWRNNDGAGLKERGFSLDWDDECKVPYIKDKDGQPVYTFEDERSLKLKCDYIKERQLLGGMYWEYTCDDSDGTMRTIVCNELMK